MFFSKELFKSTLMRGALALMLSLLSTVSYATYSSSSYYSHTSTLGNRVWLDTDMDGIQDSGEHGASGVKVFLYDCKASKWIKNTYTNRYGKYKFSSLSAGKYKIAFAPEFNNSHYNGAKISPADTTSSQYDSDAKHVGHSDHYGTYGKTDCFWLDAGKTKNNWDFGFYIHHKPANKLPDAKNDYYAWTVGDVFDAANITANDKLGDSNCAAGSTVSITSGELPDGVTLAADGTLSGVPTTAGEYWVEYELTDCDGDKSSAIVDFVVTQMITQCAIEAHGDKYNLNSGGHAIWLPGVSKSLVFEPESVFKRSLPNGDIVLWGNVTDGKSRFEVDVTFSGYMANSSNPKLELDSTAYVQNGGSIDPSAWEYWSDISGQIIGLSGKWAGTKFDISRRGPNAQLGVGANGKNGAHGLSSWFTAKVSNASKYLPKGIWVGEKFHGDFNLDIREKGECEPKITIEEYCAVSAETGDFNKWAGGHTLYIPEISKNLRFEPFGFVTQELPNGDLKITGTVIDGALEFDLDWTFSDKKNTTNDPKLFLSDAAYVANGGPIDPSTWMFYETVTGTLTGVGGEWDGVVLTPSIRTYPAQIGVGANGKNTNLGFSSWFNLIVSAAPNGLPNGVWLGEKFHGDIDIDLQDPSLCVEPEFGSWSGAVTIDTDGDNIGDTDFEGVEVSLFTNPTGSCNVADGELFATTQTLADGTYTFTDVPVGDYVAVETQPATYNDVSEVEGGADNDGVCADVNAIAGTVDANEDDSGNDFVEALIPVVGSVSGRVLEDQDRDNTGDVGIPGVTLELFADANGDCIADDVQPINTVTTGADGSYMFADVDPGTYIVVETQPVDFVDVSEAEGGADADTLACDTTDNAIAVIVEDNESDTGNDFVEVQPLGSWSGVVLEDTDADNQGDTPIEGVTIELFADEDGDCVADETTPVDSTDTLSDGSYSFSNLPLGTYIAVETQPTGFDDVSADAGGADDDDVCALGSLNVISGVISENNEEDSANDFVEVKQLGSWSGNVSANIDQDGTIVNQPLSDVTLEIFADADGDCQPDGVALASVVTDAEGNYRFDSLVSGNYIVVETQPQTYDDESEVDGGIDADGANCATTIVNTISGTVDPAEEDSGNDFVESASIEAVDDSFASPNGRVGFVVGNILANDLRLFAGCTFTITSPLPAGFIVVQDVADPNYGDLFVDVMVEGEFTYLVECPNGTTSSATVTVSLATPPGGIPG